MAISEVPAGKMPATGNGLHGGHGALLGQGLESSDALPPGTDGPPAGRSPPASRYLPGWARFTLALWVICLMLLAFQHVSLWLFASMGGER